jgi:hypothetical protein
MAKFVINENSIERYYPYLSEEEQNELDNLMQKRNEIDERIKQIMIDTQIRGNAKYEKKITRGTLYHIISVKKPNDDINVNILIGESKDEVIKELVSLINDLVSLKESLTD